MQHQSQPLPLDRLDSAAIRVVAIIGVGWVGRQVAARLAIHGIQVWLVDREPSIGAAAIQWMNSLPGASKDWLARVATADSLEDLAAKAQPDLILESVSEQLSLKKRILRAVSRRFPPPTVIASNSSYFVPSLLAQFVDGPERFAHLHFHVPVLEDSVVDIVGCEQTRACTIRALRQLVIDVRHEPLVLRREHPGYIFNWLLQSVLRSALELAALDVADPIDIDKSWKAVTGMSLGPFGIMDRIGLDVVEQVLANARWANDQTVQVDQLLALLAEHTRRGELGEKTRQGFYTYDEPNDEPKLDGSGDGNTA